MAIGKVLIKNTAFLSIGQFINIVFTFIWLTVIVRFVGPEIYGIYGYSVSLIAILIIIINYSYDQLLVLEVSKNISLGRVFLKNIIKLKIYAAPLYFATIILIGITKNWSFHWFWITFLVSLIYFVDSLTNSISSVFQAFQKMQYDLYAQTIKAIITLGGALLGVNLKWSFEIIIGFILIGSLLRVIILYVLLKKIIFNRVYTKSTIDIKIIQLFKQATPLFLLSLVATLSQNIYVILLEYKTVPMDQLGVFVAATRLQGYLMIIPGLLTTAFLPTFSKLYADSIGEFGDKLTKTLKILYLICPVITFVVITNADLIIKIIFGEKFLNAIPLFKTLSLILIFGSSYILGAAMLVIGKQKLSLLVNWVSLVISIILTWLLLPMFGVASACYAQIVIVVLGHFVFAYCVFSNIKNKYPFNYIIKQTILLVIVYLVWELIINYGVNAILASAIMISIYVLGAFKTSLLTKEMFA